MFKRLNELLNTYVEKDPAVHSKLEVFFLYPGVHATIWHRVAHWMYNHKMRFWARLVSEGARRRTGIDIHPGAVIGRRFVIDHGIGVVIGETAIVGDDVLLYQGATLGGSGKDTGKRHPTLEDGVTVGAGARVLGNFTVGAGARIAANAVVLSAVPPDATAVGVPARIVRIADQRVNQLDHVHMPDPLVQELCRINRLLGEMTKELAELKEPKEPKE
ncbi:MAG: serine O-acetyltransferase [Christensenellaceae bacterium]|jgi:serine O-acetyltransferase|nr:serine O-acetyltransferase [Christensenellaceae bacterium]